MTDSGTAADALVRAATDWGVEVCFANPGTTEMPLVAALDRAPGMRAILGLQENVCTGAADGYARIRGHAAMTLLHLGPGLANGLANLHNARRANTPLVNVVGDHASWHVGYDSPLTSDIAALAATVGTVHPVGAGADVAAVTGAAISAAHRPPGVATVIVPADHQQCSVPAAGVAPPGRPAASARPAVETDRVKDAAERLRAAGRRAVLLLGGNALTRTGQRAAQRLAAHGGVTLYCETFPARADRGGGLPPIPRLPYFPEAAAAALREADAVVVAGARPPVAYFGYEGLPSVLTRPGTLVSLAAPPEDAERALTDLADLLVGASGSGPAAAGRSGNPPNGPGPASTGPAGNRAADTGPSGEVPDGSAPLTGDTIGRTVALGLPENAIVSIEGATAGYPFFAASALAPAHTVLTNTGGAIGQGLPCALGAAVAAPDRTVVALQSDGSGLYTPQALWTMAREGLNVVVLIAANHTYQVLRTELARHGNQAFGPRAGALTSLADPRVDWLALAGGFGVPGRRVADAGSLRQAFSDAVSARGPHLIEMTI